MHKRIFISMMLCAIIGISITFVLVLSLQYRVFSSQAESELRQNVINMAKTLDMQENQISYLQNMAYGKNENRVTYIDAQGIVIYDSYEKPEGMDNHIERPEIMQADIGGLGQAKRYSDTLSTKTYYCAATLQNNSYIRIAKTTDSILSVFFMYVPLLMLLYIAGIALCFGISYKLSLSIVKPINNIDLSIQNDFVYGELSPFFSKINEQNIRISEQIIELEKRADTINSIIRNMKEGFILVDSNGYILSINPGAISLLDGAESVYNGKHILDITRNAPFIHAVDLAKNGIAKNLQLEIDNKVIDAFFNPVTDKTGEITGSMILIMDITEKSGAEALRKEFSANVSHELKTPLTTILGYSEMIVSGMAKKEDINMFAQKIVDEVRHLIVMIEDIMKLSRLDENPYNKNFEWFDLVQLIHRLAGEYEQAARENGVSIEVKGERFIVNANKTMIKEMVKNLIDNAVKYNKPEGIVHIFAGKTDSFVEIKVSDTGIGIPAEHLGRVFERFYRVDGSRSKKTGGTGLGLSIVKNIAKYHNGAASIESEIGKGTIVTIKLNVDTKP